MTKTILFNNVSKQFRLGVGVTTLRGAFSDILEKILNRSGAHNSPDKMMWALKNVNFNLEHGQRLGIIGPNGAGKTTILKLLSKITQPTSGTIYVNGRVSALIELGAGFHPDLTGRENLYLNATILGLSRREIDEKFDDIVDFSGLHDFLDTPVKRYSSGMYVRLGFAIAAHVDPDVLLVDEVLAVGDASFRRKCIERFQSLQKRGVTIVFISHNTNLVRSVCNVGMFLLNGQTQVFGPVESVIEAYETYLHNSEIKDIVKVNKTQDRLVYDQTPINITKVELIKNHQNKTARFSYDDNVEVRVHYSSSDSIQTPSLLARIIRSDGTTCCEIRTRNYNLWLPDIQGSSYFSFYIEPLQLASGTYMIETRIQDTADIVPLAVGQSDWFQVTSPGVTVIYDYGGIYVPDVRWGFQFQRMDDPGKIVMDIVDE